MTPGCAALTAAKVARSSRTAPKSLSISPNPSQTVAQKNVFVRIGRWKIRSLRTIHGRRTRSGIPSATAPRTAARRGPRRGTSAAAATTGTIKNVDLNETPAAATSPSQAQSTTGWPRPALRTRSQTTTPATRRTHPS